MFAISAAEFAAKGAANIFSHLRQRTLVHFQALRRHLRPVGSQQSGIQLVSSTNKRQHRMYQTFNGSNANGLRQGNIDWDVVLPHVELAYNKSVSQNTGLAPHEIHMGRIPRLALFVLTART